MRSVLGARFDAYHFDVSSNIDENSGTENDSITVYEWSGHDFRALSDPLEIDGTIVAMWSAQDEGRTRAVVRNLKTGNYEAYLLKVGCSQ